MKYRQVTERIGEYLGPIDWSFYFEGEDWNHGGCSNPECIQESKERLRQLTEGDDWIATTDGGYPRFGWYPVIQVGMYDGWPYWKPYPSVCLAGQFGPEWHSFCSITDIKKNITKAK